MDVEALKQNISTHIQHLKKDNTLEAREEFNATRNGQLKIIDENIDFSDIAFYINDTLYTALLSNPETTLLHNFDTYKLEIHALLFQTPTKENQQQLFNYLTT
ncbi:MAG: hypothetical protein LBG52_08340 [Candidatus Peribacteria bacterium]|jgi:hypothetical protein|nr:hypothetical protein [Candidatus Peribacteria bacterium]